jgi:hypothetical protein
MDSMSSENFSEVFRIEYHVIQDAHEKFQLACRDIKLYLKDIPTADRASGEQGMKKILSISNFGKLRLDYVSLSGKILDYVTKSSSDFSEKSSDDCERELNLLNITQKILCDYKEVLVSMFKTFSSNYLDSSEVYPRVDRFIRFGEITLPKISYNTHESSSDSSALASIH